MTEQCEHCNCCEYQPSKEKGVCVCGHVLACHKSVILTDELPAEDIRNAIRDISTVQERIIKETYLLNAHVAKLKRIFKVEVEL